MTEDVPKDALALAREPQKNLPEGGAKYREKKNGREEEGLTMCGIVGYVGGREATPILLDGLKRLEYRGYDSAGIAVVGDDGVVRVARSEGKLGNLTEKIAQDPPPGRFGVGHTRWATHGRPSEENAHPHRDASGRVVVIHNGIIENFLPMKQRLQKEGVRFLSETDTEVVAQALGAAQKAEPGTPFAEIVRRTAASLEGMFALVLFSADEPGVLYALKWGPPIVLGLGTGENFVASDATALLPHTRDLIFLEDGDLARVTASGVTVTGFDGTPRERPSQPRPVGRRLGREGRLPALHGEGDRRAADGRRRDDRQQALPRDRPLQRGGDGRPARAPRGIDRVQIVACGTSWHAGLVGKFLLEEIARIPADVDYASEFRYRSPLVDGRTLVLGISQSGETADTVAALKEARRLGARTIGLVNVPGSAIARMVDGVIATHAGPEIGVASTKAFTTQLVALALFAHYVKGSRAAGRSSGRRGVPRGPGPPPRRAPRGARPRARDREGRPPSRKGAGRPLPRARRALPDRPRGGAQAQGDLVPPRGGLSRRRDEARPDRPHRRRAARHRPRARRRALREDRLEPQGGEGAGRRRHRAREPGRRGRLHVRRRRR